MTKEDLGHLIIASTDSLYRISKSILRNETDCEDAVSEAIVKSFDKINTLQPCILCQNMAGSYFNQ